MANVVTSSVLDLASVGTIFYDGFFRKKIFP